MKYLILFLMLLGTLSYGGVITKKLLIPVDVPMVFGDIQFDANGVATLLNGKTADQAAVTFWPAARAKFPEIRQVSLLREKIIELIFRLSHIETKLGIQGILTILVAASNAAIGIIKGIPVDWATVKAG